MPITLQDGHTAGWDPLRVHDLTSKWGLCGRHQILPPSPGECDQHRPSSTGAGRAAAWEALSLSSLIGGPVRHRSLDQPLPVPDTSNQGVSCECHEPEG